MLYLFEVIFSAIIAFSIFIMMRWAKPKLPLRQNVYLSSFIFIFFLLLMMLKSWEANNPVTGGEPDYGYHDRDEGIPYRGG